MNKEMIINDILYNDINIDQIESIQLASTIEQDFKSFSLYGTGNTIACDLTEEDLLFLEAMGI